jgi:hypothetical protein
METPGGRPGVARSGQGPTRIQPSKSAAGISSDSFSDSSSDSYGVFGGSPGTELFSESVTC